MWMHLWEKNEAWGALLHLYWPHPSTTIYTLPDLKTQRNSKPRWHPMAIVPVPERKRRSNNTSLHPKWRVIIINLSICCLNCPFTGFGPQQLPGRQRVSWCSQDHHFPSFSVDFSGRRNKRHVNAIDAILQKCFWEENRCVTIYSQTKLEWSCLYTDERRKNSRKAGGRYIPHQKWRMKEDNFTWLGYSENEG